MLFAQPLVDLVIAAARAMVIPTAAVGVVQPMAVVAAIEAAFPHVGGTTSGDVPDDLAMTEQNAISVLPKVRVAVPVEDVGQ